MLRPQDVFVLCKLLSLKGKRPPIADLAADVRLSGSQVHASLKRLERAGLVAAVADGGRPILNAVEEFFVHGLRYAFPASRGELTRGVPTSYAAPPLNRMIDAGSDPPPVWPSAEGAVRGTSFEPLHKLVPSAVSRDATLYELLALIDALRDGRARERALASKELTNRLQILLRG